MGLTQLGNVWLCKGAVRRDQPVAVTELVATSERERSLDVSAGETLAKDVTPVHGELDEKLVEVGVRREGVDVGLITDEGVVGSFSRRARSC